VPAILLFVHVLALTFDPFAPVMSQIYYDGEELEHYLSNMQL